MSRFARIALWAAIAGMVAALGCSGEPGSVAPADDPSRPHDSLESILAHADEAYRDGNTGEAQNAYEEALRVNPDQARAVTALGTCYLKNRLTRKAEDLLEAYLGRHPGDAAARLVLARVYVRESELEKAAEALRAVLSVDADNLMAHYNLGLTAYKLRRFDEAEEHLTRTIALQPEHPEAHYTLGVVEMARGRYPEAIAELQKAVAIDPKHLGANFNLIAAYARTGRTRDAERQQRIYADLSGHSKAKEERKTQIATQSARAMQLLRDQKYPEALSEYERLAGLFPDDASIRYQVGVVLLRLGRRAEALTALQKAAVLDPRLSDPHYLLSNLYRESGDDKAAARELSIFATLETIPEGKSGY